jgi:hypothetical protein
MDFRGQTEPNRVFGVVSDGRIPLPCKEEGSTEQVKYPSIVGGTADFDKNSSPTVKTVGDKFFNE